MRHRPLLHRRLLVAVTLMLAGTLDLGPSQARAVSARAGLTPASAGIARPPHTGHDGAGIMLPRVARRLIQGDLRIIAFGSSSTQGVGASSLAASYPSRLQADLAALLPHTSVAVINQGIGGDDALDLAHRLPEVLAERPDLVIFQTGTNDPLRGLPLERFVALTREAIHQLRDAGVDVMLMEPQLCRITQSTPAAIVYRDAVRAVAQDAKVPVIRRWELMQSWLSHDLVTPVQMLAPDGLHMADAGYALLAREVAREILADAQ